MAAASGFIATSATVAGVALTGFTEFTVNQPVAARIDLRSDGELYAQKVPLIPGNVEIEFATLDLSAALAIGTTGSLSIVSKPMTGGVTLSGTLTFSATSCTIVNLTRGTDKNGNAIMRGTLVVLSADGSASGLSVVAA